MAVTEQIIHIHIHIHAEAPAKPKLGGPCNGCGVCCAAEPCPVSLAFLWPHVVPCKALKWHEENKHYRCGMVVAPSRFIKWLPKRFDQTVSKVFKRWVAADTLCDSDVGMD